MVMLMTHPCALDSLDSVAQEPHGCMGGHLEDALLKQTPPVFFTEPGALAGDQS